MVKLVQLLNRKPLKRYTISFLKDRIFLKTISEICTKLNLSNEWKIGFVMISIQLHKDYIVWLHAKRTKLPLCTSITRKPRKELYDRVFPPHWEDLFLKHLYTPTLPQAPFRPPLLPSRDKRNIETEYLTGWSAIQLHIIRHEDLYWAGNSPHLANL